ncbi:envelope stress response membrane protein PspB [Enterobacillus tribolii]|uniref:Phage shock protein B n=1 Tax=Enterobacillus tribolii TaxID=1487935 RepID=A0A370R3H3_9GAMM|nr:envelope stress response membrane protein PspB [Enterobacillus tribolii]MBW7984022.1 envelope stress response membrane protein PspB [Enterobacillus tribolii]RDK96963.1 phage shock protein B [Enterobacillus tribolii]
MAALFLAIPLTIFVLFVLPVWLWLHYQGKRQNGGQLNVQERQELLRLTEDAQRMRQRINALEDILDAQHPNWRDA